MVASSCFDEVETKNFIIKSIKINNQEWMITNLDISHFRNGDLILHAKTDEEWKLAGVNKKLTKFNRNLYGKMTLHKKSKHLVDVCFNWSK